MGGGILNANAQDIITTKDAEEIQAKVTEITPEKITYRKWDNMEGPTYSIPKTDVLFIKYQNGEKEIFKEKRAGKYSAATSAGNSAGIKFQSDIYLGTIFGASYAGPTLDVALGARIGRHFFIGAQTGFRSVFEKYLDYTLFEGYVTLEANMKAYIPLSEKIRPYINCSLGGFFGVGDLQGLNGFSCQAGAGLEIDRVSIGIGYNGLVKYGTLSMGYIKIGIRLGKN